MKTDSTFNGTGTTKLGLMASPFESSSDEKARKTAEIGHIERDGAWDPAVVAGSDGLSLCDDSCEAVSGEASVKRVLGLGGVFRGGCTVERSPAYQPCLLLAPGPACVAAAPRVAPPCLQSTLCNPLLRATPSTRESWASVERAPWATAARSTAAAGTLRQRGGACHAREARAFRRSRP